MNSNVSSDEAQVQRKRKNGTSAYPDYTLQVEFGLLHPVLQQCSIE